MSVNGLGEEAVERSQFVQGHEQVEDLRSRMLQTYREWCERWGHSHEGWKIEEDKAADALTSVVAGHGWLMNPIGIPCTDREAVLAQIRISEMAAVPKAEIVAALQLGWLVFDGKPTLRIAALWDGQLVKSNAEEGPIAVGAGSDPAVLICFEGEAPSSGKWLEPLRVYKLLEHGYRLTNEPPEPGEVAIDSYSAAADEEIPF